MGAILNKDFYKVSHYEQYPPGTEFIYSNFTARDSRINGVDKVLFFGLQNVIKKILISLYNEYFFEVPANFIIKSYQEYMKNCLGDCKQFDHIRFLHKLGYLPIEIKALPEGSLVPLRVPLFTIKNTLPEFFWLPNMLETLISCELWQIITSATIANEFRVLLEGYSNHTCDNNDHLDYQAHDFSMRGMSSLASATGSGMGHLLLFKGTDTIPAIISLSVNYYAAYSCGSSVAATEHSVMQAYGQDNELQTYKRLITEIYPSGIVSIVSDTWDLFNVVCNHLKTLKEDILKRDGKVVIRPDSGNPIDIICGTLDGSKGVIECLWDIFGGHVNSKGFRVLDPHIGCIYGDSITYDICEKICERLQRMGFASSNIVFGIGSFTYQYNTRDTFGFAMKSTWIQINGEGRDIFKDPKTDNGIKKSLRGRIKVTREEGKFKAYDHLTDNSDYSDDCLRTVFKDGELIIDENLDTIKNRLKTFKS